MNSAGQNLGRIGAAARGGQRRLADDRRADQELTEQSLQAGIEHARTLVESESGYLKANAGAAVVLDPQTGAIEAMASFPSFDPSVFTRSISKRVQEPVRLGARRPLLNRAIQGQYPPGSTYKPFVAASALQREIVTTGQNVQLPAQLDRAVR